jgi:hypothetical protein
MIYFRLMRKRSVQKRWLIRETGNLLACSCLTAERSENCWCPTSIEMGVVADVSGYDHDAVGMGSLLNHNVMHTKLLSASGDLGPTAEVTDRALNAPH